MSILVATKLLKWGIVDFGYTTEAIPLSVEKYNSWILNSNHLPLTYLEGHRQEKRQGLKEYWPECESALVFLFSYHETHQKLQSLYQNDPSWNGLKLASYTLGFGGFDYHHKIKESLIEIGECLKHEYPDLEYKLTLDTQPILERDLAMRAGLGWFGKNSMLINRQHGSFFIIGGLLLNKKIPNNEKRAIDIDHCGQCTKCIDACPTNAIDPISRTIIAIDCISTFTIEQFKIDTIPSNKMTLKEGTIFGCDICQDVCPWNKRVDRQNKKVDSHFLDANQNKIISFFLTRKVNILFQEINTFSEGAFRRFFKNTSFERSGKRGFLKNIIFYISHLKKH
jgi:epoxyqueuosine reductase